MGMPSPVTIAAAGTGGGVVGAVTGIAPSGTPDGTPEAPPPPFPQPSAAAAAIASAPTAAQRRRAIISAGPRDLDPAHAEIGERLLEEALLFSREVALRLLLEETQEIDVLPRQ